MQTIIFIISIIVFIVLLPFCIAWGMLKGGWQEVEELFLSMFVW